MDESKKKLKRALNFVLTIECLESLSKPNQQNGSFKKQKISIKNFHFDQCFMDRGKVALYEFEIFRKEF